jgi:hypothetical protein
MYPEKTRSLVTDHRSAVLAAGLGQERAGALDRLGPNLLA